MLISITTGTLHFDLIFFILIELNSIYIYTYIPDNWSSWKKFPHFFFSHDHLRQILTFISNDFRAPICEAVQRAVKEE